MIPGLHKTSFISHLVISEVRLEPRTVASKIRRLLAGHFHQPHF